MKYISRFWVKILIIILGVIKLIVDFFAGDLMGMIVAVLIIATYIYLIKIRLEIDNLKGE